MRQTKQLVGVLGLMLLAIPGFSLSIRIGRDVNFPKNYDPQKEQAIRSVIQNEYFRFVDGTVSYWEPDYGTRLSYEGDAQSLSDFLATLRKLPGFSMRILLYHGRNDELCRDSSWQFYFSQARPNQLTVYINVNSSQVDLGKVNFPEWPVAMKQAQEDDTSGPTGK